MWDGQGLPSYEDLRPAITEERPRDRRKVQAVTETRDFRLP